jgi:hypothetical protein
MNSHFLLPCECGQTIPIQLSQAGQSIQCGCGRTLSVPNMRGIRQLQTADAIPTKSPSTRTWNPTRGLIFGIGAISILIGCIVIGYNYPSYRYASAYRPSEDDLQQSLKAIDDSPPEDLWKMWHDASKHGMGDHESSFFVGARRATRRFQRFVITGAVLLGLGVICVTAPLVIPNRKPAT